MAVIKAGVYCAKESPSFPYVLPGDDGYIYAEHLYVSINFTNNNNSFDSIEVVAYSYPEANTIFYGDEEVYEGDGTGWIRDTYRTINIESDQNEVDETAFAWFNENYEEYAYTAPTATYDLSSLNMPSGSYSITVVGSADEYSDSEESNAEVYEVP